MKIAKKKTPIYIARWHSRIDTGGFNHTWVEQEFLRLAAKLPKKSSCYGFNGRPAELEM